MEETLIFDKNNRIKARSGRPSVSRLPLLRVSNNNKNARSIYLSMALLDELKGGLKVKLMLRNVPLADEEESLPGWYVYLQASNADDALDMHMPKKTGDWARVNHSLFRDKLVKLCSGHHSTERNHYFELRHEVPLNYEESTWYQLSYFAKPQ